VLQTRTMLLLLPGRRRNRSAYSLIREAKNYPQVLAYNNSSFALVVIFCAREGPLTIL
jgi:hypothetical protein